MADIATALASAHTADTDSHHPDAAATRRGPDDVAGGTAAALVNAVIAVHKAHIGRGPTRGRAYVHSDVVTCVLRDALTRAERTLVEVGEADLVRAQRQELHRAMAGALTDAVSGITQRPVVAVFGAVEPESDIAANIFLLGPAAGDGAAHDGAGAANGNHRGDGARDGLHR